jgi:hypothetical protein
MNVSFATANLTQKTVRLGIYCVLYLTLCEKKKCGRQSYVPETRYSFWMQLLSITELGTFTYNFGILELHIPYLKLPLLLTVVLVCT